MGNLLGGNRGSRDVGWVESLWTFFEDPSLAAALELARKLDLPPSLAPLLCRQNLLDEETAGEFLQPRLKTLSDPFLLPEMREAVTRILQGVTRRERIALYGDYDVDGVTSLAMLHRMLVAYGVDAACFLPLRADEGYGLSQEGVERCLAEHRPQLLIAVDCGTSSAVEIADLHSRGIDVVVIDHHEGKVERPKCVALVNPKLGQGFHYLCSAGLVFKVCHALLKTRPLEGFDLKDFLDLAAVGTIADLVPLVGENRLLARHGLERLARTKWIGLEALMHVAGVKAPLRAADIGFKLGPRLNAAGRLGTARDALKLLLCEDWTEALELATGLNTQNTERQSVERRIHEEALQMVAADGVLKNDTPIIVGSRNWNSGVVGIVASRLMRKFYRPSLVLAFDENGVGKGSGRSIEGFSLVHALGECSEHLQKFGGHEMAAGLTIREQDFQAFINRFRAVSANILAGRDLRPRLHLDAEVRLADLDMKFLAAHGRLEPFGMNHQQPVFFLRKVAPAAEPRILKEKHLRLDLRQNGVSRQAIFFNGPVGKLPAPPWDVAFQVEANTFREETTLQIQVQALRTSL